MSFGMGIVDFGLRQCEKAPSHIRCTRNILLSVFKWSMILEAMNSYQKVCRNRFVCGVGFSCKGACHIMVAR